MKKHLLKIFRLRAVMLVALLCAGFSGAWGETETGTITFGNGNNGTVSINKNSITAKDNLGNDWTITTEGTYSFTPNGSWSQVGSSSSPATSITFTTTLPDVKYITAFSAKFGGYSGTEGNVNLNLGETNIGSGNLNGTSDVTISTTSGLHTPGNILTVTVTDIAKGVKVYNISYSYETTEIPTHIATFSINGNTNQTAEVAEGAAILFPTVPANIYGKTFVGWATTEINGEQNNAPAMVSSATMGTADVTYYAVFAYKTEGETKTDELDRAFTEVTGTSYSNWSGKKGTSSNAVYAGNSAGGNSSIQLRQQSPSGIVTTTSGGNIKKITISWNTNTSSGRTLNVYGKNTAYSNVSDLYNSSNQGTLIGTIVRGTNTSLTITGDYAYIGLRSSSGAMYLNTISIEWQAAPTYSAYCTTIPNTAAFTLSENCYDLNNGMKTYYGTFSNSSAFVIPEGVTAHTVSVANGVLSVTDYEEGAVVPANTGVMVSSSTAGEKTVNLTNENGSALANNMLKPTGNGINATNMAQEGYKFYYLTMNGDQIGFWWKADDGDAFDMNVANKAYLAVPAAQVGSIKGFSFNDVVDGIKAVETTETENNAIYNLAGQRVNKMQKGIYVVNGKKILVK